MSRNEVVKQVKLIIKISAKEELCVLIPSVLRLVTEQEKIHPNLEVEIEVSSGATL